MNRFVGCWGRFSVAALLSVGFLFSAACNDKDTLSYQKSEVVVPPPEKDHILNAILKEKCTEEVQRIKRLIRENDGCKTDNDCTVVNYGCHFGCYAILNREYKKQLQKTMDEFKSMCFLNFPCGEQGPCPAVYEIEANCVLGKCAEK